MDFHELKSDFHVMRKQLGLLAMLLALAAGVYFFSPAGAPEMVNDADNTLSAEAIRLGAVPIPAYSSSTEAKLESGKGFQHVVSYTNLGFEPRSIAIKTGETIRFTNNSPHAIWIAGAGGALYPGVGENCGSSALDSCGPIDPLDFWEFTFDTAGEWGVVNNLDKTQGASIRVQ